MAHTPGPWTFSARNDHNQFNLMIAGPDGSHPQTGQHCWIARVFHPMAERILGSSSLAPPSNQSMANAYMIAAVPDLLAACENIISLLDEGWLVRDTSRDHEPGYALAQIEPVRKLGTLAAAISKAKGTP